MIGVDCTASYDPDTGASLDALHTARKAGHEVFQVHALIDNPLVVVGQVDVIQHLPRERRLDLRQIAQLVVGLFAYVAIRNTLGNDPVMATAGIGSFHCSPDGILLPTVTTFQFRNPSPS